MSSQTFSIHLPGQDAPDWSAFPHANVEFLSVSRHHRKLRRGALAGNAFVITLRDVGGDRDRAEQRLRAVQTAGVANYFGEQRFGHGGGNVAEAESYFRGQRVSRQRRSLLISAARSHIFNAVLAERVAAGSWNQCLDGEVCCLEGSRSWFALKGDEADLQARLDRGDIHPSGPLWGRGLPPTRGAAAQLETQVAGRHPLLRDGLASAGLKQDRRALRLMPSAMQWRWLDATSLQLSFRLPAGAYATTVLREISDWS